MPKKRAAITINEIISVNVRRAREARGWTQEQAAQAFLRHRGERLSKSSWSLAESPPAGRIRQWSGDDIVALALTFDVPVAYFFEAADVMGAVSAGGAVISGLELLALFTPAEIDALQRQRFEESRREMRDLIKRLQRLAEWNVPKGGSKR